MIVSVENIVIYKTVSSVIFYYVLMWGRMMPSHRQYLMPGGWHQVDCNLFSPDEYWRQNGNFRYVIHSSDTMVVFLVTFSCTLKSGKPIVENTNGFLFSATNVSIFVFLCKRKDAISTFVARFTNRAVRYLFVFRRFGVNSAKRYRERAVHFSNHVD